MQLVLRGGVTRWSLTQARLLLGLALVLGPACSGAPSGADASLGDGPVDGAARDRSFDAMLDQPGEQVVSADGPSIDGTAPLDGFADLRWDASAPAPVRVATFNCHCLLDNPLLRARGIAAEIVRLAPDVVALQEICQTAASPKDNFAAAIVAELKTLTGQSWTFTFERTHQSWSVYDEGIGLLVPPGRLVAAGAAALPQGQGTFPRKVAWARVARAPSDFYGYSTHLTISSDPADRAAQAQAILALVAQHGTASLPQVVMGDFNDWYGSAALSAMKGGPPAFVDAWGAFHPGAADPGLSCCAPNFATRIDYVLVRDSTLSQFVEVELAFDQPYGGVALSDHRGLFVTFIPR